MRTKILSLVLTLMLTISFAGVSLAAKRCKGKVAAIEGNTLVIESKKCGEMKIEVKNADDFAVGDKVKVKGDKVKKARAKKVEGC